MTTAIFSLGEPGMKGIARQGRALAHTRTGAVAQTNSNAQLTRASRLLQQVNQQLEAEQFQEAIGSLLQALTIYQNADIRTEFPEDSLTGENRVLEQLSQSFIELDRDQEALDALQQRLIVVRDLGDRTAEAQIMLEMRYALSRLDRYQQATEISEQGLAISREIGDRALEVEFLLASASLHFPFDQYQQAMDIVEQALPISRELGDTEKERQILYLLAFTYSDKLGQYPKAIQFFEQAFLSADFLSSADNTPIPATYPDEQYQELISMFKELVSSHITQAGELHNLYTLSKLGNTYLNLGEYVKAFDWYEQTLNIARAIDDRQAEGIALNGLASVYLEMEQYEQAITFFEQDLAIVLEINDLYGKVQALGGLTLSYLGLRQTREALSFGEQYLLAAREKGDRRVELSILSLLGNLYSSLEQYENAIAYYRQGLALAREMSNRTVEEEILRDLELISGNQQNSAIGDVLRSLEWARDVMNNL